MRRHPIRTTAARAMALAILCAGCAKDPGSPTPVTSVVVAPADTTVHVNTTVRLSAVPRGPSGASLSGRPVTWTSSDTTIATVTREGAARALGVGTATITATSEGQSATARINVLGPFVGLWSGVRYNPDGQLCCSFRWNLQQQGDTVTGLLDQPHTGCARIGGCPVTGVARGNQMTFVISLTFALYETYEQGTATISGDRMTGSYEQCVAGVCTGGLTFDITRQP
jgi:hypothetical protein